SSISAQRQTEPARLSKLVRGELDWIVMKALEKDRNRRYETANAQAADVQRYLQNEPVQACPPSALYRFRTFARRNKGPVLAGALVVLALVVGIVGTSMGLYLANEARKEAVAAEKVADQRRQDAELAQQRAAEQRKEAVAQADLANAVKWFLKSDVLLL